MFYKGVFDGLLTGIIDDLPLGCCRHPVGIGGACGCSWIGSSNFGQLSWQYRFAGPLWINGKELDCL
jgi:hypothetical protein